MALTSQRFIDALRDFSLLGPDELAACEAEWAASTLEMADLARRLVQAGKLTEYQAAVLSEGAGQSLVYGEIVVLDKLGAGGMGRVYKALHRRMKRIVALKVLPGESMEDQAAVLRFQREVEAAATLRHPNIVTAFDAGEANGVHFLVMEYVEGRDLLAVSCERGMLPLAEALDYTLQVARGLAYAHSRGVVHRDVKPANLLLDPSGTVKILDMGVARFTNAAGASSREITVTGEVMGSIDYMAPEQVTDVRLADARADIYSLGFSLYRLLTCAIPYNGVSLIAKVLAHRDQPPPPLRARRPDVTPELEAVYERMVAKRPEDRYQDMAQVIAALEACRQSLPPAAPLPDRPVLASTPDDETLSRTMFARRQASHQAMQSGGEAGTGRSLVRIELDPAPGAGAASQPAPVTRWRHAVPAIAGAVALSIAVVAGVALFKKEWQQTAPTSPIAGGSGRGSSYVDSSGKPRNPVTVPATTTTASGQPPASSPSPSAPDQSPGDADRRTAEWAIGLGGQVAVRPPGSKFMGGWIVSVAYLPLEEFRVWRVMVHQIKAAKITDPDLENLRELTELEDLNLGGSVAGVTDRGMATLARIKSLSRLDIDGAGITDRGIASLRPLTGLTVLSLSSTGITDTGLDALRSERRLQRLYLQHTVVTDKVAMMARNCWPELTELGLPDGAITDQGLASLASLQHLNSLPLSQTRITNEQLLLLADIKGLRTLRLDGTSIDDAGLENLNACHALTFLSVRDTKVTGGGVAGLRQALPDCKVDFGTTATKPATP